MSSRGLQGLGDLIVHSVGENEIATSRRSSRRRLDCGNPMRIIAFIEDHNAIDRIIRNLKVTFAAERPPPP